MASKYEKMTRSEAVDILIAKGKAWYPTVRAKANHARMSQVELDLYIAIRELIERDGKNN